MPDYRRIRIKGGTYFFTVVTFDRKPILTHDHVRAALREGIQEVRHSLPFTFEAWVLLPDHLHTTWTLPEDDDNYGSRWAVIKRIVSKRCSSLEEISGSISNSRSKRGEGQIWQRRFWEHYIRDESDFERCVDYIHWNPMKHGYVQRIIDWPYSTFHRFVKEGIYPPDWSGIDEEKIKSIGFGE
jgi:putative transposase